MANARAEDRDGVHGLQDRQESISRSGMRFVGRATELLRGKSGVAANAALESRDLVFATRFTAKATASKAKTLDVVLSVLNRALSPHRIGEDLITPDNRIDEEGNKFHRVFWETFSLDNRWAGQLTWIHPHPFLGGIACTTRVALTACGRADKVDVRVHVGADGGLGRVRGSVGAGQVRPAFLDDMKQVMLLSFGGQKSHVRMLTSAEVDSFVRRILLAEDREYPVAVLAPVEPAQATDPAEYLVHPEQVGRELLGLAHLYVIDQHPATFTLSDSVGDKRLSCFRGALRVYQPDFTCADDPMSHPLLVAERLQDPVDRTGLVGLLGQEAVERIPLVDAVGALKQKAEPPPPPPTEPKEPEQTEQEESGEEQVSLTVPAPEPEEAPAAEAEETDVKRPAAGISYEQVMEVAEMVMGGMDERLSQIVGLQQRLVDEISRLRTATVVRSANASGVERRLSRIERMIRKDLSAALGTDEEAPEEPPEVEDEEVEVDDGEQQTLVSVLQHVETEHANELLILESAFKSAAESPFEDVERVALYLKVMADLAKRRQEGRVGMSLREAFNEAGIEYRGGISQSTSKQLREQYQTVLASGEVVECHEHLVLGSSYDPRYCLRIYFTSKATTEPRFVIAHVGKHFRVKRTN